MALTLRGAALNVRAIPEANNYTVREKGEREKMQINFQSKILADVVSALEWRGF